MTTSGSNCNTCEHRATGSPGHCYMFETPPASVCLKHTAMPGLSARNPLDVESALDGSLHPAFTIGAHHETRI